MNAPQLDITGYPRTQSCGPWGFEPDAPPIPLFDRRDAHEPDEPAVHEVFLCTPKDLFGSPRMHAAATEIRERHPHAGKVMLAHELWRSNDDWRATYRNKLAYVTHVYTLTHAGGYIGTGQFAELVYLTGNASPLCFHAALVPRSWDTPENRLVTSGFFEPSANWSWGAAAKLVRPSRARCVARASVPCS